MKDWFCKYHDLLVPILGGLGCAAVVGVTLVTISPPEPKPPTTPALTQSQLDQAVSMLDRHGNTTEANKAKIMKIENRLKQLEQRMNATLPDPMRMK